MTRGHKKFLTLSHVVLIIVTVLCLLPFYLLIVASFTDESFAVNNGFSLIPSHLSVDAYRYLLTKAALFGRGYLITLIVTVCGTLACIVITLAFSYMLSRPGLPFRRAFNFYVVFTMLFNGGLVPTYIMYVRMLHIKNTIFGLIVPNMLMSSFMVMLVRNYFENSVPRDLYEACRIDGATEFQTFFKVALPLSTPILATVGLMMGIAYWNDWQNGLYYLSDSSKHLYTIQNILNNINDNIAFLASNATSGVSLAELPTTTVRMAIAVVGILPILILYPFFQKYFAKGITMGAVKG